MNRNKDKDVMENPAFKYYIKWRNGFVMKMTVFHISLVILFDAAAIYTPAALTKALWQGSAFSTGIVVALGIIISVIISAFYYSYRISQEEGDLYTNGLN